MELEILDLTVGQLRELFAHADADLYVREVWEYVDEEDLERVGFDPYEDDEDEDEDEEDYDYDEEEYDDEDEDEIACSYGDAGLDNPEEEALAQSIAADINAGRYTYNVVYGMYPEHIIERIEELA